MALLDDKVQFTIKLHSALGEITKYEYPSEAKSGDSIKIFVDVKNNSESSESYILALVNNDTDATIDTKTLSIGANSSSSGNEFNTTMPSTNFNLRLDLFRVV